MFLKHSDFLNYQKSKKVFVIKSTVPPGTTELLSKDYPRIDLCFSPEFLTEANSWNDFKHQSRIIIGGDGAKKVKQMLLKMVVVLRLKLYCILRIQGQKEQVVNIP